MEYNYHPFSKYNTIVDVTIYFGHDDTSHIYTVNLDNYCADLKQRISADFNLRYIAFFLTFNGQVVQGSLRLAHYGITQGSTLHAIFYTPEEYKVLTKGETE